MKKIIPFFFGIFSSLLLQAQLFPVGCFDAHSDIGPVLHAGSVQYHPDKQDYLVKASGSNIWAGTDEFHFAWKKISGDFILRTQLKFLGKGGDPHRKAGLMVRQTLDPNSAQVSAAVHGDGLTALQFRKSTAAETAEKRSPRNGANVLQLERKGNRFLLSVAREGDLFEPVLEEEIDFSEDVFVGIFVCAHHKELIETAIFHNLRIVVPKRDNQVAYRDYLPSMLEILDIGTGQRKLIYQSPHSIQAPNWTPDGKALVYNRNGLLYRFDLKKNQPTLIPSDFANRNNNDHVISFSGKMLAISHHSQTDSQRSIIYTLPVTGGTPKRITALGPSYLHGWSPDDLQLTYTAQRKNDYEIYVIDATGGNETRLTFSPGLDDGPEFSPDGKYIYFNSVRSGTMQLWRMKPDGTDQEQLTNDELNNWFPHISPNGKWIVYLSFGKEVDPSDHPFYKPVYLRLMPASGGPSRVIAYLYGGQGTINTPSWAPDSQHLAFVSNSNLIYSCFPLEKEVP